MVDRKHTFNLCMLFLIQGAVAGGVFGLVVVVAAGGGAQLAQLPMPRLPASTSGCVAPYNMTTHMTVNPE